jgi:hypothetical protein
MRRLLFLAVLCAATPAGAHFMPGDRMIVVQAEPRSLALLVSYKPPSGVVNDLLDGEAALNRAHRKGLYAARALAPIKVKLDGAPLDLTDSQIKLVEDPPGSGRTTVVVLISGKIPAGAHRVTVDVAQSPEPTSTEWIDHSEGNVVEFGPRPSGTWVHDRASVELVWGTRSNQGG